MMIGFLLQVVAGDDRYKVGETEDSDTSSID